MIPGAPNLMIAGGGDPLDELGKIDRSVRYRKTAGASASRTPAVAGNRKTFLFATWVKRGATGTEQVLLCADNGNLYTMFGYSVYRGVESLRLYDVVDNTGTVDFDVATTGSFRDIGGHMLVVLGVDTTQSVAANRVRIWVNFDLQPLTTYLAGYPALNRDTFINAALIHKMGALRTSNYLDGLLSFPILIDGYPSGVNQANWATADLPSLVAVKHPRTGQVRPKSRSALKALADAGGVNSGFWPQFDPTSLTTLFADDSVHGNNWTASNISLTVGTTYDSLTDTPTNNYCALNPLRSSVGATAVTDGGLTASYGSGNVAVHSSMIIPKSLPIYFEGTVLSTTNASVGAGIGVARANIPISTSHWGGGVGVVGLYSSNSASILTDSGGSSFSLPVVAAGTVLQVFVNGNNVWIGRNNVWYDSAGGTTGNPSTGANPTATLSASDDYIPYAEIGANSLYMNFGQRPFAFTPPTGYKTLCTKNLVYPAVTKSSSAFAAVTDTGANILATLAAAESWSSYIRIVKRRDSAEGWRWSFSDDPGYALDSALATGKFAYPALAGTSYVGYSLKVSATNGVATGRLVHTNGVADTVTDGLGNTRKAIILTNEAGSTWYFYHPDLTAGKLLYLNTTAGETADASISSVLSNSFVVAAALPSGTYRWIALAEVDGFLKLGKCIGNGSTDGAFKSLGMASLMEISKPINGSLGDWWIVDGARNRNNPVTSNLLMNSSGAEGSAGSFDADSNGVKNRSAYQNENGTTHAYIDIGAFPFRYANAR